MPMEVIKVFCDVVEFRNISTAAAANNLSQPTVSRIVHELEVRLGGPLLDRSHRPLQLTPMGQTYYEGCKALLESYAKLEASLHRHLAPPEQLVQVAAIYSVGLWDMGQYVERCESRFPDSRVHIHYLHPDVVYQRVLAGQADLGLVSFPKATSSLLVLPWRDEEMVVVCRPGHRLAQLDSVRPSQLHGEKFVAFDRGLVIRRELDRFLRAEGVNVEVAAEFDNIETIKKGIEVGAGISLLPEPMIRRERDAGTLKGIPLSGKKLVRPLGIIHRVQHTLCPAAQGFIDLLRFGPGNADADGAEVPPQPKSAGRRTVRASSRRGK
jgi:DNA-binding transcriptional LysR family regulator